MKGALIVANQVPCMARGHVLLLICISAEEDQTSVCRYVLGAPAAAYFGAYSSAMQKLELCGTAASVWRSRRKISAAKAAAQAAAELGLDEEDCGLDIAFAEAQIAALVEAQSPP